MILRIVAFVTPLMFDTLAVAIALGLRGISPWRPAVVLALFEAVMPIFGIVVGHFVGDRFERPSEILGGIVLVGIGIHAFREVSRRSTAAPVSFASLRSAAIAGIGVSMDELAAGFPLGVAHLPIGAVILTIGVQAFLTALVGIFIGSRAGAVLGDIATRYAHVLAGVAFSAVGIWLIAQAFGYG